jgi:hypothetical protein
MKQKKMRERMIYSMVIALTYLYGFPIIREGNGFSSHDLKAQAGFSDPPKGLCPSVYLSPFALGNQLANFDQTRHNSSLAKGNSSFE